MRRWLPLLLALVAVAVLVGVLAVQTATQRTETGLVVAVDSAGLADVRGFTLRTNDGRELEFRIGGLENGTEFPPGHLSEHVATGQPVRVFFRDVGGEPVVYRLEDAPQG